MARVDHARAGLTIRCAIYTRKSSDEGLNQEFNSLDAQREACEAYIVSQRHAGWVALANMYDDGGLSGGTMERPALKRLLEDIEASKVQIVVVYKVDRLTRSLSDFAKIVDVLDAHNASFVPVTQQFNTTVLVHADGFEWNGRRYRSLTIVAVRSLGPIGRVPISSV
jgi:site-specific DNA recombinase